MSDEELIDPEQDWQEFWRDIVANPDGTLNLEQVKKELADFHYMMKQVPAVYGEVSGGKLSKPYYPSGSVIQEFQKHLMDTTEREVAERTEDLVRLARAAMPDNMIGGTPDLAVPEGYERCEDPWEAWQQDMERAIRQIPKDPTAPPQAGTAQEPQ